MLSVFVFVVSLTVVVFVVVVDVVFDVVDVVNDIVVVAMVIVVSFVVKDMVVVVIVFVVDYEVVLVFYFVGFCFLLVFFWLLSSLSFLSSSSMYAQWLYACSGCSLDWPYSNRWKAELSICWACLTKPSSVKHAERDERKSQSECGEKSSSA